MTDQTLSLDLPNVYEVVFQTHYEEADQYGDFRPQNKVSASVTIFAHMDTAQTSIEQGGKWLRGFCKWQTMWALAMLSPLRSPKAYVIPEAMGATLPVGVQFKTVGIALKQAYSKKDWENFNCETSLWQPCLHLPQTLPQMMDCIYYIWQNLMADLDSQVALHLNTTTNGRQVPTFQEIKDMAEASGTWAMVVPVNHVHTNHIGLHTTTLDNSRHDPVVIPPAIFAVLEQHKKPQSPDQVGVYFDLVNPVKVAFTRDNTDGRLVAIGLV